MGGYDDSTVHYDDNDEQTYIKLKWNGIFNSAPNHK